MSASNSTSARGRTRRFGVKCRIGVCMTEPMYRAVERLSRDHGLDLSEVVRRLVSRQLEAQLSTEIDTPSRPAQNRLTRSIY